ncbi:MAG: hypothetical protein KN64_07900 [Sulfurovum sp. AS07-7]|nr:MAG: hypothetical protein KN64_07900 [Sulfurovum sp. AS07-7]
MKKLRFVDISGFGLSGKGAFLSLLSEFRGFKLVDYNFEFDLFRAKDGILDLKYSLVDNWSPVRSSEAIYRFKVLTNDLALNPQYNLYDLLTSSGSRYDRYFDNKFTLITNSFIDSLITDSYSGMKVLPLQDVEKHARIIKKILFRFGFKKSLFTKNYITNGKDFEAKVNGYINMLFSTIADKETHTLILNNACEPYNPMETLKMIDNSKCIIIDRDPRDIFVTSLTNGDNDDIPKDYKTFVKRFRYQREQVRDSMDDNTRVLRLRFEDLVLNYDMTVEQIMIFLELDAEDHIAKNIYFDPKKSSNNVMAWKQCEDKIAINYIERHLSEYIYLD